MAESEVGLRVFEIRRALGPNPRRPLAQEGFAELLNAKARELGMEVTFYGATVSTIESGARRLSLEEVALVASLDPLQRGRAWLAWGDAPRRVAEPEPPPFNPEKARLTTPMTPVTQELLDERTGKKKRRRS